MVGAHSNATSAFSMDSDSYAASGWHQASLQSHILESWKVVITSPDLAKSYLKTLKPLSRFFDAASSLSSSSQHDATPLPVRQMCRAAESCASWGPERDTFV